MFPGNIGGGGAAYGIQVPVQTYGKENLDKIAEAISKTTQRVQIGAGEFRIWTQVMARASDEGYTVATSINRTNDALARAGLNLSAFTDRLRDNVREQNKFTLQSGRTEAVLGRISGRIGGAELIGGLGIPGGGFIGSQLFQSLGISGSTALAAGGAVAAVTAGVGIYKAVEETAKYAQEQFNLSKELGITVEQTQLLGRVSEVTGIQTNSLFNVLRGMTRELTEFGPKTQQVNRGLHELGLSAGIIFEKPYDQLMSLLGALGKVDQATREHALQNIFGSAHDNASAQLLALADNYKQILGGIQGTGVIINDKDVDRLRQMAQDSALVKEIWGGIAHHAATFIESLQLPKWLLEIVEKTNPGVKALDPRLTGGGTGGDAALAVLGVLNPGLSVPMAGMETFMRSVGLLPELRERPNLPTRPARNMTPAERAAFAAAASGDARLADANKMRMSGMTEVEGLKFQESELKKEADLEMADFLREPNSFKTGPLQKKYLATRGKIAGVESSIKTAEDRARQEHEFQSVKPIGELSLSETETLWRDFPIRYKLIMGQPAVRTYYNELTKAALNFQNEQFNHLPTDPGSWAFLRRLGDAQEKEVRDYAREKQDEVTNISARVTSGDKVIRGTEAAALSRAKFGALSGEATFSRYGLTPLQVARHELQVSQAEIQDTSVPKAAALMEEIMARRGAINALPGFGTEHEKDLREKLQAEIEEKHNDLEQIRTDTLTKSVEALKKFNEVVDHTNEQMRSEFSGGFASAIMGLQHGGGKGLTGALRGFFEKQESTVLQNIGGMIWGQGGPIHAGQNTTLGKVLTGTIFGPLAHHEDASKPLKEAAQDLKDAARELKGGKGGAGATGTAGSGGAADGIGTGAGSTTVPSSESSGAAGTAADIGGMAAAAATLGGMTSGSASKDLKAVAGTLSKLDAVMKGTKYSGNLGKIFSGTLSTGQEIGAIAGTAALGIGAYEGISTITKGGAKNVAGGLGGTLASAAPFTGPAAPFVAAAGAIAGLVSAFLPDLRQQRSENISKELFGQQYLAPQAIHLSEGGNAGFSDFDTYGNVRQSNFSPYPVVSNSYLDVPRRTVVPGHTVSTFGGYQGTPSAGVYPNAPRVNGNANAPTYHMTIVALDSQSFIDRAEDVVHAFHRGISNQGHPVINALAQQMGLR